MPHGRHPLQLFLGDQSLSIAVALHELGVTHDGNGNSYTTILMTTARWAELKAWLSPNYARYSMPNDWLSERLSPQLRGWTPEAASSVQKNPPFSFGLNMFGSDMEREMAALSSEQRSLAAAEMAHQSGELVLGEATHMRFFHMTWGSLKSVEMLALGAQYWNAVHRPRIVRAIEAHLIPDLASEVIEFLTPHPAHSSAVGFGGLAAVPSSAAAASMSTLSTSLRTLLRRAQTGVVDPAELASSLSSLVAVQSECEEAIAGEIIAQKLAQYSITPPS